MRRGNRGSDSRSRTKMKVLFALFAVLSVAAASKLPASKLPAYASDFDDIDLEEILKDRKQVEVRVNCLLDKNPCPPDAALVKQNVEESLENGCERCTEKQREGVLKVLKGLSNDYPELMQKLYDKYDPEGLYRMKYEAQFNEAGIKPLSQP